jgi:hypothetical protein
MTLTEQQIQNNIRIRQIFLRLGEIAGRREREFLKERKNLKAELKMRETLAEKLTKDSK